MVHFSPFSRFLWFVCLGLAFQEGFLKNLMEKKICIMNKLCTNFEIFLHRSFKKRSIYFSCLPEIKRSSLLVHSPRPQTPITTGDKARSWKVHPDLPWQSQSLALLLLLLRWAIARSWRNTGRSQTRTLQSGIRIC